jgi:tetratricopeptide (TPR) repeat protein
LRRSRYEDAAQAFGAAARLTPGVPAVHTSLGAALAHLHRWHEAAQADRQALLVDPTDPDAHYNLGVALSHLGAWTAAINEFRAAAQFSPIDADARYNLGIAFRVDTSGGVAGSPPDNMLIPGRSVRAARLRA